MKLRNCLETFFQSAEFDKSHVFLIWMHQNFYFFNKTKCAKDFSQSCFVTIFFFYRWDMQCFRGRIHCNWTFRSKPMVKNKLPIIRILEIHWFTVFKSYLSVLMGWFTVFEIENISTEIHTREIIHSDRCKVSGSEFNVDSVSFCNNAFDVSEITE